jgi:hypothetical protein
MRAISSLPVPLSLSMRAVECDGATWRTIATSCLLCGLWAMKPAAVLAAPRAPDTSLSTILQLVRRSRLRTRPDDKPLAYFAPASSLVQNPDYLYSISNQTVGAFGSFGLGGV